MFKKFLSSILTVVFVMSMIPAADAEQPRAGKTLKDFYSSLSFAGMSGGSFGDGAGRGFGGGLTIKRAGAGRETGSSFGGGAGRGDWGSGFNKNYGLTFTGSGAKNNFQYNDISSVTNITIANTTNNTFYNPVTNNYNTYNNISYNNAFNTYYMEGDKYNSYITNNATYISYYVIDNSVQETYYYEIYYQLPDGRNSYDLDPEDVWGTYFMYNVTNYREVVEDDGKTLALWHLDGDTKNAAASGFSGELNDVPNNYADTPFGSGICLASSSNMLFSLDIPDEVKTIEFRVRFSGGSSNYIPVSFGTCEIDFVDKYTTKEDGSVGSIHTNRVQRTLFKEDGYCVDLSSYSNSWISVAMTREESSKWKLWINGKYKSFVYSDSKTTTTTSPGETESFYHEYITTVTRKGSKTLTFQNYYGISPDLISDKYDYTSKVYSSVIYDEVRLSNNVLYTENYTPRTQPFDTNKVLVVPDASTMSDTTIAVKSSVPVGALRVGGVRPTFPANGDVYVVEEKGIVKDVQQFQQDGWYSVQASLYIDGEWKLFFGFDISGFGLNKPDSPGGGTGPGGSGDSGGSGSGGGSGGGDSGGGSGFWDKLLQSTFGGILSVLASLLSGLLTLLGAILTMLLGIVGYIGIFLPFLPGSIVTLIGGGVFIVLALVVIKFIGGLL